MEDVQDNDCVGLHAIEDKILAVDSSADAARFVMRNQGEGARGSSEAPRLLPQFPDEAKRAAGIVLRDEVTDLLQGLFG